MNASGSANVLDLGAVSHGAAAHDRERHDTVGRNALGYFDKLGTLAWRLWREASCDERRFPEVAMRAFAELPSSSFITPESALDAVLGDAVVPRQPPIVHGEPPTLVVYDRDRIGIQLRFWSHESLTIHQHDFSGAFHVIAGTCTQSTYRFDERRRINSVFSLGEVEQTGLELLGTGDTRRIDSGNTFIHSLFHLQLPTVTVTLQTKREHDRCPCLTYLRPFVAYDPFARDDSTLARLKGLDALLRARSPRLFDKVEALVGTLDLEGVFRVLHHTYLALRESDRLPGILAAGRKKHGEAIDAIVASLEEQVFIDNVVNRRADVRDEQPRLLLGLALNATDRSQIIASVASVHGLDELGARSTIKRLAAEMIEPQADGSFDLLGVEVSDDALGARTGELLMHVVGAAVDGGGASLARARIAEAFSPALVASRHDSIDQLWAELARGPLRPLFVAPPSDRN